MSTSRAEIKLYCHPELKELLEKRAIREDMTLTRYLTMILAAHVKRPALRNPERAKMGRPKKAIADAQTLDSQPASHANGDHTAPAARRAARK